MSYVEEAVRGHVQGFFGVVVVEFTHHFRPNFGSDQARPAGKQLAHPIYVRFHLCSGNAKPEGSPILPHEPPKIKQEEGKDITRPSRPAVSLKSLLRQNAGNRLFVAKQPHHNPWEPKKMAVVHPTV